MKKLFFILLLITVGMRFVNAQPTIQWEKSYGSIAIDRAFSIQQTTDKGFIIVGAATDASGDVSVSYGQEDYWIVKTDSLGTIQWEKSFGGTEVDIAHSVQQTTDGGYIVAGFSQSIDGDVTDHHGGPTINDFWVIKLGSLGNLLWKKSYGGNNNESANYIQQTTDGGYILAGISNGIGGDVTNFNGGTSDYWIVKIDSLGTIEWQKSFGGSGDEEAYSVQQTIDGEYIVAGVTTSNNGDVTGFKGGADYWVLKLDTIGNLIWKKVYGGPGAEGASSIRQLSNGSYIIVGASNSMDGDVTGGLGVGLSSVWVVKIDSIGNIMFEKHHNNAGISGWANDVFDLTTDGGYVISGTASSNSSDYWVIKADSLGSVQWEKQLGGSGYDDAGAVRQTNDGGYIVVGETWSWSGNGDISFNNGAGDYWLVKLNAATNIAETQIDQQINIYPNPTNGLITVSTEFKEGYIELFDLTGKKLMKQSLKEKKIIIIDVSPYNKGIYLIKIISGNTVVTKKIVYQ